MGLDIRMRGKWKRDLLYALGVGYVIGLGITYFWIHESVDPIELCHVRSDGIGLFALDEFGPNVRCDPKWGKIAFASTYYAAVLLIPLFILSHSVRWCVHLVSRMLGR